MSLFTLLLTFPIITTSSKVLASDNACFNAFQRTESTLFNAPFSGTLIGIELIYSSGWVDCGGYGHTHWGCNYYYVDMMTFLEEVTNSATYEGTKYYPTSITDGVTNYDQVGDATNYWIWYSMASYTVDSPLIVFLNPTYTVSTSDTFMLQYGEASGQSYGDNEGTACAQVYFIYQEDLVQSTFNPSNAPTKMPSIAPIQSTYNPSNNPTKMPSIAPTQTTIDLDSMYPICISGTDTLDAKYVKTGDRSYYAAVIDKYLYYTSQGDDYSTAWSLCAADEVDGSNSACCEWDVSDLMSSSLAICTGEWSETEEGLSSSTYCPDMCSANNYYYELDGTYVWHHYNISTDSSVYYCASCVETYLFLWLFSETEGDFWNWRIGIDYTSAAAWVSCNIERTSIVGRGGEIRYKLSYPHECDSWSSFYDDVWNDDDITMESCGYEVLTSSTTTTTSTTTSTANPHTTTTSTTTASIVKTTVQMTEAMYHDTDDDDGDTDSMFVYIGVTAAAVAVFVVCVVLVVELLYKRKNIKPDGQGNNDIVCSEPDVILSDSGTDTLISVMPLQSSVETVPGTTTIPCSKITPKNMQSPACVEPIAWVEIHTSDGKVYYQNNVTKATRWDKPPTAPSTVAKANETEIDVMPLQSRVEVAPTTTANPCIKDSVSVNDSASHKPIYPVLSIRKSIDVTKTQAHDSSAQTGWVTLHTKDNRVYYQNNATKQTKWPWEMSSHSEVVESKEDVVKTDGMIVPGTGNGIVQMEEEGAITSGFINSEMDDDSVLNDERYSDIKQFFEDMRLEEETKVKYFKLFIVNGFDTLEIVKTISHQDLLDIGVVKLSHRKMILSKAQEVKQYPIMMDAPPGYDARNDTLHQQDGEVASVKEQVNCNNEPLPSEPGLEMELVKVDDESLELYNAKHDLNELEEMNLNYEDNSDHEHNDNEPDPEPIEPLFSGESAPTNTVNPRRKGSATMARKSVDVNNTQSNDSSHSEVVESKEDVLQMKGDSAITSGFINSEKYSDIKQFFEGMRLEEDTKVQYFELFIVNGFDALEIVKTISYQDLLDIGVSKLSHRKMILSKAQSADNITMENNDAPPAYNARHDNLDPQDGAVHVQVNCNSNASAPETGPEVELIKGDDDADIGRNDNATDREPIDPLFSVESVAATTVNSKNIVNHKPICPALSIRKSVDVNNAQSKDVVESKEDVLQMREDSAITSGFINSEMDDESVLNDERYSDIKQFFEDMSVLEEDVKVKYFKLFIVNGFDALEIVKTISYQDLLDIGVSKLSHRKIILSKAQSLDNDKDDTPPECDAQHDYAQQEQMNSNTSQHGCGIPNEPLPDTMNNEFELELELNHQIEMEEHDDNTDEERSNNEHEIGLKKDVSSSNNIQSTNDVSAQLNQDGLTTNDDTEHELEVSLTIDSDYELMEFIHEIQREEMNSIATHDNNADNECNENTSESIEALPKAINNELELETEETSLKHDPFELEQIDATMNGESGLDEEAISNNFTDNQQNANGLSKAQ